MREFQFLRSDGLQSRGMSLVPFDPVRTGMINEWKS